MASSGLEVPVTLKVGWVVGGFVPLVLVLGSLNVGADCADEVFWVAVLVLGKLKVGAAGAEDAAVVGVLNKLGVGAFEVSPNKPSDGADVAGVPAVVVPKPVAFVADEVGVPRLNSDFGAGDVGVALFAALGCELGRLKSGLGAAAVPVFEPEGAELEAEPKLSWKVGAGFDGRGVKEGNGEGFPAADCAVGVEGFWAPRLGKRLGVEVEGPGPDEV